jgi:hypothetical protein
MDMNCQSLGTFGRRSPIHATANDSFSAFANDMNLSAGLVSFPLWWNSETVVARSLLMRTPRRSRPAL